MKKDFSILMLILFAVAMKSNAQWNLKGNSNATNTSLLGTTNAMPLNLTTNNIKRMVIDANGKVGIGTTTPINIFSVKSSGGKPAAFWVKSGAPIFTGFGEQTVGNGDLVLAMASSIANARPVYLGRRSRGKISTPTKVVNADQLTSLIASGYDGTSFQNTAAIDFLVEGNVTPGNVPTRIAITTGTNADNRTERLSISSTGNVAINGTQLTVGKANGNVGIGLATPAALLEIKASDPARPSNHDGILIPGVYAFPVTKPTAYQHGMMVFLRQVSGSNQPGFYYWDNVAAKWKNIAGGSGNSINAWGINGNAGTNAATNFIGTTDAAALNIRVNNNKSGMIAYNPSFAETSFGYLALSSNFSDGNTAFGYRSQVDNTSGFANTSAGQYSMEHNTTGFENTAFGSESLRANEFGYFNTAIGQVALGNTTGFDNTALGRYTLLTATTGTGNTALGSAANLNDNALSNVTLLGFYTVGTADQSVQLGNNAVTSVKAANNVVIVSDARFKRNVQQNVPGLAFINALQPVTYNYDVTGLDNFERAAMPALKDNDKMISDESMRQYKAAMHHKETIRYSGFVAQEVEKAATNLGYDFSGVYKPQNDKDLYGLSYAEFVVPLVKAVQELSKANEQLTMKNDELKANDAYQQKQIDDLKAMLSKLVNDKPAMPCLPLAGQ